MYRGYRPSWLDDETLRQQGAGRCSTIVGLNPLPHDLDTVRARPLGPSGLRPAAGAAGTTGEASAAATTTATTTVADAAAAAGAGACAAGVAAVGAGGPGNEV
jgi:hypothetical protein